MQPILLFLITLLSSVVKLKFQTFPHLQKFKYILYEPLHFCRIKNQALNYYFYKVTRCTTQRDFSTTVKSGNKYSLVEVVFPSMYARG
jgi:hypothetical protein